MNSNIHIKILNPEYDQYVRWNYSIRSGQLYNFPENAIYPINDQIYIENVTYPDIIVDSLIQCSNYINLTRAIKFKNETINSCFYIP